ncbi:Tnt-2 [Aphelenchoides fujianensis]|nr:Tnt-2 [Aphelenchoides fujianensis]
MGVFAAKANPTTDASPASSGVTRLTQAPPPDIQASQSEFMNRLMAAHKAVDDLLNRRGLKGEDETKFLRMYEWVPVIEEEPPPPLPVVPRIAAVRAAARRSVSTESDSGFSMDSDHSDESIEITADECALQRDDAEDGCAFSVLLDAAVVAEQIELCAKLRKTRLRSPPREEKPEENLRPPTATPPLTKKERQPEEEPKIPISQPIEKKEEKPVVVKDDKKPAVEAPKKQEAAKPVEKPTVVLPKPRSVVKVCSTHKQSPIETIRLKPVQKREPPPPIQAPTPNPVETLKPVTTASRQPSPPKKVVVDLKPKTTNERAEKKPTVNKLKQPEVQPKAEEKAKPRSRLLRQQTAPTLPIKKERVVGRLQMPDEKDEAEVSEVQRTRAKKTVLDQPAASRTTNARFRNAQNVGSSAEISIQHVSFYETARAFTESKEKCLRIHLRLTSRADRTGAAATILPTNERKQRVFLEVRIPLKSRSSTELDAQRRQAKAVEMQKKKMEERKPPRRKLIELPTPPPFHAPKLRILTDTTVRMMQEKLKQRHQQQAELQTLRGNLKRVPRVRRASSNQAEQRKTAGNSNGTSTTTTSGPPKRKIVKRRVKKPRSPLPPAADGSELKKADSKNEMRARRPTETNGESSGTMDEKPPAIPRPASQEVVTTPVSNRLSRQSKKRRAPLPQQHERVNRVEEWERRLIDEFRRFRHIPVLEAIWRQIFCQRCVLCHLLEPARGPLRSFFIRRQQPEPWSLASLEAAEILQIFTIWKEKVAKFALRPTPAHRSTSGEEEEIDEEEEEEPITEAIDPPPAPPADDAAAPAEDAEPTEEAEGDENEPPAEDEEEKRSRRATVAEPERNPEEMTEAERAMLAVKKRQEEESALKAADADSRRKAELAQIEEELKELKVRQEERKRQRALEEAEYAERQRAEQEKRRHDEEERKAKMEADKARRAEEKCPAFVNIGAGGGGEAGAEGKNFVLPGKTERPDEKKEKKSGVLSKEQKEAIKQNYMSTVNKPIDTSNMLPNDLKAKIKQLHAKIVRMEAEKYDATGTTANSPRIRLLKELLDREKQKARNKQIAAGAEPVEAEDSNRPPKIQVASKFDRQVDRRGFREKHDIFQNPVVEQPKSIARGSGKPPEHWGRKQNEEIEALRKNLEPPKQVH